MRADISKYLKLTDYEKALKLAISSMPIASSEVVNTEMALGRISDETIASLIDIPESDIAMMDGYAVKSEKISSDSGGSSALYITTGSPIPEGYDAVVKVEDTRFSSHSVIIRKPVQKFKNVLRKGEDIQRGSIIARKGDILNPASVSLLLYEGIRKIKVKKKFSVGILSIGRELKDNNDGRVSNNYAYLIHNYIKDAYTEPSILGIVNDDRDELIRLIEEEINEKDMLITIGRSSVGLNDTLLQHITSINSEVVFHGVKLLPARPTGLVRFKGKPVWMLPAHAVSSVIALFTLVIPSLTAAILGTTFNFTVPSLLQSRIENIRFLPSAYLLRLKRRGDKIIAYPLRWGSNLMSSLLDANAYLIVPPRQVIREGEEVKVNLLGAAEFNRIVGE